MVVFVHPRLVVIGLFTLGLQIAAAQSPIADLTVPVTACIDERIEPINNSMNADSYEWDFCLGDFQVLKNNTDAATVTGLSNGYGYRLVEDNGQWFGFAVSQTGSKLFRLDFGNSPLNTPAITDLGDPGGLLVFPHEIDLIKDGGLWYGFVTSNELDQGLVRLDFGSSLTNTPAAANVGNFGVSGRIWDLRIVRQNADLILVMAERNSGSIIRVNFRDSFDNPIVPAFHVFDTGVITGGGNTAPGIEIVRTNTAWIALLVSHYDGKIYQVSFGSDLLSPHTVQASYTFPAAVDLPYRISVAQEGNQYYATVSNETLAIKIIDFKDLNPANPPSAINHTGLPVLLGIDAIRFKGQSILQGVGIIDNILKQSVFESPCGASTAYDQSTNPLPITYSTNGTKLIELKAINSTTLEYALTSRQVVVSSSTAPDIDFSLDAQVCAGSSAGFTSANTSGNISNYAWDFGDTGVGTGAGVSHIFAAGNFTVRLNVTATNGCGNSATKPITIFNPPVADFSLPAPSVVCTNQNYTFSNTTSFDAGSNPSWQWNVNGSGVSSVIDLIQSFSGTGSQVIQLVATIPGCSSQKTQNFTVQQQGPTVDFSVSGGCQGTTVQFTNNTSGTITGYAWTFGDGNSSTLANPQNTYSIIGPYTVLLSATNAGGCINSSSRQVIIHTTPQPDFTLALPPFSCSGTPSQFDDATPNPTDSNLSSWSWSFGDAANGSSTQRNPLYTYITAGPYTVGLKATTNFGCSASTQKSVTIAPSPVIDFTNTPACVNQGTQFTDASGGSIKSWLWKIGNSTYTFANPIHVFGAAGDYPVQMTVTASNNCVAQLTKSITIPEDQSPDFSAQSTCATKPAIFQDVTPPGADPFVSYSWDFASIGSGLGSPAQFTFPATGKFSVKMDAVAQSGCGYSVTKTIEMVSAPTASFVSSTDAGAVPLDVQFNNYSTNATGYQWHFGDKDNSTSAISSPTFTFNELGDYVVDLEAMNLEGCKDTYSTIIHVLVPRVDATLTDLAFVRNQSSGALQVLFSIDNLGNLPLKNPMIRVEISGSTTLEQNLNLTVLPGQHASQVLNYSLLPGGLDYVCVEVNAAQDMNPNNDKQCASLEDQTILFAPYPNPSDGELQLDWIGAAAGTADIAIFNSTGAKVFEKQIEASEKGLNQIRVDISNLSRGVYMASFSYPGKKKTFRFVLN